MKDEILGSSVIVSLKYLVIFLIPFVEPQLAGMLGGFAYLIVRHELLMSALSVKSVLIVLFFGWMGAWATVNIITEHYSDLPHVWEHIFSATVGFLSYDAMLIFGANTKSVIGFFTNNLKTIMQRSISKWNS